MFWLVLTILAMLVVAGAVAVFIATKPAKGAEPPVDRFGNARPASSTHLIAIGVGVAAFVLWLIVTPFFMFHTVGQRQVAIVYNFSGTITGKKDPGVVVTMPWQHVKKENVGILHDEWQFSEGNSAVSKDQQPIFGKLAVNYQIEAENVVDLYKRVGASWKTIIVDSRVPQVFKETTASYQTPDITAKREQLRRDVRARLSDELTPYDIRVVDVFVTNLGFSSSYTNSIEAKQKQVQDALRQEAKIREAEAIGDQKVATAERNARANIAEAKGEATANRLRRQTLTPLLIQQQAIEKLNPAVQVIVCPPGTICIPNSGVVPAPSP